MSRSKLIGLTFSIAAMVVLVGFSLQQHHQAARYERLLTQSYTHAFTELTTAAGELDTALEKATYTTPGPLQTSLYQQIYAKALSAQTALGQLPYGNVLLEQTASFYAKTGDYALALTRNAVDSSQETLSSLSSVSKTLYASLSQLQTELEHGKTNFTSLESALAALSAKTENGREVLSGTSFQTMEAEFPELPSLVYDGPFSEHLTGQTPKALVELPEVTAQQARLAGANFLHVSENALTLLSDGGGSLPTYSFSLPQDGGTGYLEVTQQGGQILSYFLDTRVKQPQLSEEEAVVYAENYLVNWGFPQMDHSYTLRRDGKLTIHFAPVTQGVYCYPDLVKLTISLADGSLVGYESQGYLSNHTQRTFPTPAVSQDYAALSLPNGLIILSSQLALIPTAGGTEEVLTYEFKTENSEGQHILFYINAQTGLQQNILLLLEDESGTLAL